MESTYSREKEFLVARWEDRRKKLKALVAEAEAYRNKEIYGGWKLKEFLAHMSGWDDAVIAALKSHAEGTEGLTPAARARHQRVQRADRFDARIPRLRSRPPRVGPHPRVTDGCAEGITVGKILPKADLSLG